MNSSHLVDGIIPEPIGGAHSNPLEMFVTVKSEILKNLKLLKAMSPEERIQKRIDKCCHNNYNYTDSTGSIGGSKQMELRTYHSRYH